jgi:hypothetical protein
MQTLLAVATAKHELSTQTRWSTSHVIQSRLVVIVEFGEDVIVLNETRRRSFAIRGKPKSVACKKQPMAKGTLLLLQVLSIDPTSFFGRATLSVCSSDRTLVHLSPLLLQLPSLIEQSTSFANAFPSRTVISENSIQNSQFAIDRVSGSERALFPLFDVRSDELREIHSFHTSDFDSRSEFLTRAD